MQLCSLRALGCCPSWWYLGAFPMRYAVLASRHLCFPEQGAGSGCSCSFTRMPRVGQILAPNGVAGGCAACRGLPLRRAAPQLAESLASRSRALVQHLARHLARQGLYRAPRILHHSCLRVAPCSAPSIAPLPAAEPCSPRASRPTPQCHTGGRSRLSVLPCGI